MRLCAGLWQPTRMKFAFLACSLISIVTMSIYMNGPNSPLWNSDVQPTLHFSNSTKLILTWSKWFGKKNLFGIQEHDTGTVPFQSKHCVYQDCFLTSDKSNVERADVLLFHYKDSWFWWPRRRYAHQYYAYFSQEPSGNRKPHARTYVDIYEGRINVTINYRRDADLYVPYSKLERTTTVNPPYQYRIPLAKKNKMAMWPVSNCRANSKRQDYIKELRKYMSVDVYGWCGSHTCSRKNGRSCLQQWENTYKFYISFENNICDDYITEKVFLPLEYELIPVVLGGGNYSMDVPPHSVINARDFNTPKALAEFLIKLGEDEPRYHSYFNWKPQYEVVTGTTIFFCKLCQALHENKFPRRPATTHLTDYWFGPSGEKCDNELIPRMRKEGGW